jgi:hypothetical protein
MDEPGKRAWAGAYQNPKIVWICTDSGYRGSAYDPQGKEAVLPVDADNQALGVALLEASESSRFLSLDEVPTFFDYRIATPIYEARIRSLVASQRYRNKIALFNRMKYCSITLFKGMIEILPTIHEGSDSWSFKKRDGIEETLIAADRPPAEIGTALRYGFSRCVE